MHERSAHRNSHQSTHTTARRGEEFSSITPRFINREQGGSGLGTKRGTPANPRTTQASGGCLHTRTPPRCSPPACTGRWKAWARPPPGTRTRAGRPSSSSRQRALSVSGVRTGTGHCTPCSAPLGTCAPWPKHTHMQIMPTGLTLRTFPPPCVHGPFPLTHTPLPTAGLVVVDYQAACVSNTIRNMLSSQGACARIVRG